jgi:hypothetical protein
MLDAVANFMKLTVSGMYDQNATSVALASGGSKLPAAPFNMTWWNLSDFPDPSNDPNVEIVRVTNVFPKRFDRDERTGGNCRLQEKSVEQDVLDHARNHREDDYRHREYGSSGLQHPFIRSCR